MFDIEVVESIARKTDGIFKYVKMYLDAAFPFMTATMTADINAIKGMLTSFCQVTSTISNIQNIEDKLDDTALDVQIHLQDALPTIVARLEINFQA